MTRAQKPKPRKLSENRVFQWVMIVIGWAFVIMAPIVSPLPGPMGLAFFIIGAALILKNSLWAKRKYARHSKRHPEYGLWLNWAMRRKRFKVRPPFPPIKRDAMVLLRSLKKRLRLR
jgi:membrane protease YdiL (CAAX protease family)